MKLSIEGISNYSTGSVLLREVDDMDEVFFEMRRFLKVNHNYSNTTVIQKVDAEDRAGWPNGRCPAHTKVWMGSTLYHYPPAPRSGLFCFGIYYGTDSPRHTLQGTEELYQFEPLLNEKGEPVRDEGYDYPLYSSKTYPKGEPIFWYWPIKIYHQDLKERMGGK